MVDSGPALRPRCTVVVPPLPRLSHTATKARQMMQHVSKILGEGRMLDSHHVQSSQADSKGRADADAHTTEAGRAGHCRGPSATASVPQPSQHSTRLGVHAVHLHAAPEKHESCYSGIALHRAIKTDDCTCFNRGVVRLALKDSCV